MKLSVLWAGIFVIGVNATVLSQTPTGLISPTADEMKQARQWFGDHYNPGGNLLFSFFYDGKPSASLVKNWSIKIPSQSPDRDRIQHQLNWNDPQTGLEVRCEAIEYTNFPVVEWTVFFKNTGSKPTPILENIQGLDIEISSDGEYILHHWKGDSNTPDSYQPFEEVLAPNATHRFAPDGGRPTNGAFPYYNLQKPDGGLIIAVGWPGQWATSFTRNATQGLRITAGQELTHLVLKPGEEIRTPLIALLFWQGTDTARAQNLWRRWMLAHNLPRPGGQLPKPIYAFCSGGFFEGLKVSESSEKQFIDILTKEKIKLDYWWMDAGWYPCNAWSETGTWEYDPQRFPKGIKAISDYVHNLGTKLVLWFEPERVEKESWLSKNHPEWLLGGKLLNLGNLDARQWLTDHVDRFIREQGIDLYRQDFNMDPLDYWRKNDAENRQGMTENLHVQGYLAYWDELRKRHPDMLIDSCASGGRRNDLETLHRAVPLLRSDYQSFQGDPQFALGNQCHTYGISSWIPFYGQGVYYNPKQFVYSVRSYMSPGFGISVDVRNTDMDWNLYRRLVDQWRQVVDFMLCDYYPLTPYSLQDDRWIAWQFNRPEKGDGMVQAFRRAGNEEPVKVLRLNEFDPSAHYRITDIDSGESRTISGQELTTPGLSLEIKEKPGAVILTYEKIH